MSRKANEGASANGKRPNGMKEAASEIERLNGCRMNDLAKRKGKRIQLIHIQ